MPGVVLSPRDVPHHLFEFPPTPRAWARVFAWVCGGMALAVAIVMMWGAA